MRIAALTPMLVLALGACTDDPAAGATHRRDADRLYRCDQGQFIVRLEGEDVSVTFDGETRRLSRQVSASGERYGSGDWTFWSKGDGAMLDSPGLSLRDCRLVRR